MFCFQLRPRYPTTPKIAVGGFSLIEMMLVLGIIAFIAAMVAQNIYDRSRVANVRSAQLAVKKIASEAQAYLVDTGTLPTKLDDLLVQPQNLPIWNGPYLRDSQVNDAWHNRFVLKSGTGFRDGFVVLSFGADGKEGGTGFNADISSAD